MPSQFFSILIMLICAGFHADSGHDHENAIPRLSPWPFAQQHVEEMRGSLIVPEQFGPSGGPQLAGILCGRITSSLVPDPAVHQQPASSSCVSVSVRVQSPYGQPPVEPAHLHPDLSSPGFFHLPDHQHRLHPRQRPSCSRGWVRDDGSTITGKSEKYPDEAGRCGMAGKTGPTLDKLISRCESAEPCYPSSAGRSDRFLHDPDCGGELMEPSRKSRFKRQIRKATRTNNPASLSAGRPTYG